MGFYGFYLIFHAPTEVDTEHLGVHLGTPQLDTSSSVIYIHRPPGSISTVGREHHNPLQYCNGKMHHSGMEGRIWSQGHPLHDAKIVIMPGFKSCYTYPELYSAPHCDVPLWLEVPEPAASCRHISEEHGPVHLGAPDAHAIAQQALAGIQPVMGLRIEKIILWHLFPHLPGEGC